MYLIFGSSNYGKTDALKGLFYVVTEFFHVYYVPIIPLGSRVMVEGTDEKLFKKIGFSWKSVLVTYLRGVGGVAAVVFTAIFLGTIFEVFHKQKDKALFENQWYYLGAAIVCWSLVVLSYFWTKPSPVRALELAKVLNIPMEDLIDHYLDDPRVEMLMSQAKEGVDAPVAEQEWDKQ